MDLHDALILVQPCDITRLCYLSVFLRNNTTLDGDVVWAFDVGAADDALFRLYPCRTLYIATYEPMAITSKGRIAPAGGTACD